MKVLVIGGGGREHAIAWKILQGGSSREVVSVPGNGGIPGTLEGSRLDTSDGFSELLDLVERERIDLTMVGPEAPLTRGIVDAFRKRSRKIFGPPRAAAALEGSKCFAKEFMARHKIPTARFSIADSRCEARRILRETGLPAVIKYDGLAAGKGVVVAFREDDALRFLDDVFERRVFGDSPGRVVIEECLQGREISHLVFTDGRTVLPMVPAQDYKRAGDNDTGANTGGMGSCSPPVFPVSSLMPAVEEYIVSRTMKGLQEEGIEYTGVLYFGLMLTAQGPSLLEYNARFGDPETQVILPRLKGDLLEILEAAACGDLSKVTASWSDDVTVCVVLASAGYPGPYRTGRPISGLEDCGGLVFHAGTRREGACVMTAGGRVLNVVGIGGDHAAARKAAYDTAARIRFEGRQMRTDIALVR